MTEWAGAPWADLAVAGRVAIEIVVFCAAYMVGKS